MSTRLGRQAEAAAAREFKRKKCTILAQNWRTRWCEIDIIAKDKNNIYFAEVKYRGNDQQGLGLEYITPKKLAQMQFAAEFWLSQNDTKLNCKLVAIEVTGPKFMITAWIDDLIL